MDSSRICFEVPGDWEDPDALHAVLQTIRENRNDIDIKRVRKAYYVAEQAHSSQTRRSGEPYITHPLAVTKILVDLHMDEDSLCAGLLHDVLEDVPEVTAEMLNKEFGQDVVQLIQGVTKLSVHPSAAQSDKQQAAAKMTSKYESLRKMLLAMANDYRVMVIKLADRLHNMQTLDSMAPDKQMRIAQETMDIYAPLSARLGIWQLKWQLEDLSFKYLHPREFHNVSELVQKSRREREQEMAASIRSVREKMQARGVVAFDVTGRPKHLYSIFNKMVKQKVKFEEIFDLLALRIIVDSVGDCYLALGICHEQWMPIMEHFFDYIAKPKPNGYQSLHTKVVGPTGQPLEIQIRTRQMHEIAEFGVAAHWTYKEGRANVEETNRLQDLRRKLFDWSSDATSSSEFMRSVSTDLFVEQVFVFTPDGDVLDLPQGSTPVDFAFRVHSNLGMKLTGAKINGQIAQLSTQLNNGDVVEVITRNNATPSLDWLEFVKSQHARSKIRAHFRKLNRDTDAARGRNLLERELNAMGLEPKLFLGEEKLNAVVPLIHGVENATDLLAKVGTGMVGVQNVAAKLQGQDRPVIAEPKIEITKSREGRLEIRGSGILVNRSKCCNPIPGDEVVGYVSRGKGIMVHQRICPNALQFAQTEPERLLEYSWTPDGSVYGVGIRIETVNRQGLLMDVTTILSEAKINVSAANIRTLQNQTAEIIMTIDVRDQSDLKLLTAKIGNFSDVISVTRLMGKI